MRGVCAEPRRGYTALPSSPARTLRASARDVTALRETPLDFASAHFRHYDVGQDEVDLPFVIPCEIEGLTSRLRAQDRVPERLQHVAGEAADDVVVLDHEDRLGSSRRRRQVDPGE